MNPPTVSFVIPCYKLAHLLAECLDSILGQTYSNFEVLIMDDCSPDDTPAVAGRYSDPRVKYIRNDRNIGHLQNYNKGIEISRGRYVWLISADDRLRRPYILERYVAMMDSHPRVGYVFCPGIGLRAGRETKVLPSYAYGTKDRIFEGREFIRTVLAKFGGILTPSVMVRRECYEKVSMFPLDMPHQGDMYLWFMWALEYDVAYFAEPMVNYRDHELNMMKDFVARIPKTVFTDEVNVLWRTKHKAQRMGFDELAGQLDFFITKKYAAAVATALYDGPDSVWRMSVKECDDELRSKAQGEEEYRGMRKKFYSLLAERHRSYRAFRDARESIAMAGEYGSSRNLFAELLHGNDWKYAERWKVADLRLSAARLFWCQGKIGLGTSYAIHALLTRPLILARPLKPFIPWPRANWGHSSLRHD